ncbi:glycosyltransferase family 2 protein [Lichenibacterium dinghuense]|uniref:glycosyltransferase family 2 protein n=1 Tax=Lichenibacterium dinghuense TaxID=2895977 RepID=UPI001F16CC2D|nr:glycosyltransferase [Lichenibacterium sp. 6Y81]
MSIALAPRPPAPPVPAETFEATRRRISPRYAPPPGVAWPAALIHGGLTLLWVALLVRAFLPDGLWSWAAGLLYIAYDTALLLFVFWKTLPLARGGGAGGADPAAASRPSLAVVVAAHDEDAVLAATLDALLAQSDPPDRVLVADDGSGERTVRLLAGRYGLPVPEVGLLGGPGRVDPRLSWLRLPHGGKSAALNRAMELLDEEVVLTVDADTLLDQGAIGAMRGAFAADPRLVAATGVLLPVCAATVSGRLFEWFQTYEYLRNFLSRFAWSRMDSLLLISGAFAGFRRAALVEVGGFDADCLVEDYELIHRLKRHGTLTGRGWTTAVLGAARARTEAPATLGAFLRQRRRWFGGFLQTQTWYRDMIGNPRYGRLGLAMLPVKAADTLQPIYGLTAAAILIDYIVTGRVGVAFSVSAVIGAKIALDLGFHVWSVWLFRRWLGVRARTSLPAAVLASLVEPFCFQILRHLGAAAGWVVYLTGSTSWGAQSRGGLAASEAE